MAKRSIRMAPTVADAWDQAEKLFADRGEPWAVNRRGDKFWIESGDVRVTCVEERERPTFVLNLYLAEGFLSWAMTTLAALEELLVMIDAGAHIDGGESADRPA